MGANFATMEMDGNLSEYEVRAKFLLVQDNDRYENGHSYSGGFGQATGLKFSKHSVFGNAQRAREWVEGIVEKWEEALCVRIDTRIDASRADEGDKGPDKYVWFIGALCAC